MEHVHYFGGDGGRVQSPSGAKALRNDRQIGPSVPLVPLETQKLPKMNPLPHAKKVTLS